MSFFGIPIEISDAWLMVIFAGGGGLFSAYELRKAIVHGRVGFGGREYHKDHDRFSFNLYRGLWAVCLFCSIAGLVGWHFDLGMMP